MDTNVLIESRFPRSPRHAAARQLLSQAATAPGPVRISRQVLREYLVAATRPRPWGQARPMNEALRDVARMQDHFHILEDGPQVTAHWIALCREVPVAGKQVHDANIVATMLAHGERRLATLNAKDFHRYGARIEIVSG